jgi:hypothetical protein
VTRRVVLTERRRKVVRLPQACAVALRRDFAGVVTLSLDARPGCYELAAGGYVGTFAAAGTHFTVRPKYPLTYLDTAAGRDFAQGHGDDFAATLARRFVREFRDLLAVGLLHGYADQALESPTVRGRLDFAQMMHKPSRHFPIVADEFTLDHVLNQVPKSTAAALLRCDLPVEVRESLTQVASALADVTTVDPAVIRWDDFHFHVRTAHYLPVIATARAVLTGLHSGEATTTRLFNLAAIFENELTARLAGDRIEPQAQIVLDGDGPARTLRPDFVVRGPDGGAVAVWDAKWKTLARGGPADDDLHQVLAYAAALGVRRCGLIYPGRRTRDYELTTPSGVRVGVVTVPVTGNRARFDAAVQGLKTRLAAGKSA